MSRRSSHIHEALHILALSAFAIAQPLFDVLGRHATFFVAQGTSGAEVLLFSLVLLVGPPLLIVAVTRLAAVLWSPAHGILHSAAIGGLTGLTVAPPATRALQLGTASWLTIFVGVGILAVLAYRRWPRFREMLTWAAAAALVFVAMFLFGTPVRQLLLPSHVVAQAEGVDATVKAPVPVVVLVFDELSLGSLLSPAGTIDASRFPHFARLAASSTWYRNATTNAEQTSRAIPALLTGRVPDENKIPAASAYPDNLFTLLSGARPIHATEYITRMCPPSICRGPSGRFSLGSLFSDARIVYLHTVLPADIAEAHLPSLAGRWAHFDASSGLTSEDFTEWRLGDARSDRVERFASITDRINQDESPALWYVHIGLPHEPWHFLPTLQVYAGESMPGFIGNGEWGPNQRAVDHSLQRYLFQVQAVDHLLGRLLDRLRDAGLYDESLLIVLADHGVAFNADGNRRALNGKNTAEILPVPLFVKYPGQKRGRVDARNAELIDVLPTIADVLDIQVPWTIDGASLRRQGPERRDKRVFMHVQDELRRFNRSIDGIDRVPQRIAQLFGRGRDEDDLYRFGPHRDLVGRSVSAMPTAPAGRSGARVHVDNRAAYQNVNTKGPFVPALLMGAVTGPVAASTPVAVAVNGSIAGTGWTYRDTEEVRISIMLSPRYFSPGRNDISVYVVDAAGRLTPLQLANPLTYRVLSDASQSTVAIEVSDGRKLPLGEKGFGGMLDRVTSEARMVSINGWAADLARQRTPHAFLVVHQGKVIHVADARPRPDVARYYKNEALMNCGIRADIPAALVADGRLIQVYAIFDDTAFLVRLPEQSDDD